MRTLADKRRTNGRTLALDGAAWRKLRASVLRAQPLCRCGEWATDVDHKDNNATNNERSNLQGLCHECHSRKTQADMGNRVRWGCDANGMPLDPSHPWHSEKSPATDGTNRPSFPSFYANRENQP